VYRLAKLQEGKKAEMEVLMNSTISKWLEGLDTKDVAAKDQLKSGLQHLIDDGNESGVWNVIACASSSWIANVNSIEALTNEVLLICLFLPLGLYLGLCSTCQRGVVDLFVFAS
jgi:hypothetical protein